MYQFPRASPLSAGSFSFHTKCLWIKSRIQIGFSTCSVFILAINLNQCKSQFGFIEDAVMFSVTKRADIYCYRWTHQECSAGISRSSQVEIWQVQYLAFSKGSEQKAVKVQLVSRMLHSPVRLCDIHTLYDATKHQHTNRHLIFILTFLTRRWTHRVYVQRVSKLLLFNLSGGLLDLLVQHGQQ